MFHKKWNKIQQMEQKVEQNFKFILLFNFTTVSYIIIIIFFFF